MTANLGNRLFISEFFKFFRTKSGKYSFCSFTATVTFIFRIAFVKKIRFKTFKELQSNFLRLFSGTEKVSDRFYFAYIVFNLFVK